MHAKLSHKVSMMLLNSACNSKLPTGSRYVALAGVVVMFLVFCFVFLFFFFFFFLSDRHALIMLLLLLLLLLTWSICSCTHSWTLCRCMQAFLSVDFNNLDSQVSASPLRIVDSALAGHALYVPWKIMVHFIYLNQQNARNLVHELQSKHIADIAAAQPVLNGQEVLTALSEKMQRPLAKGYTSFIFCPLALLNPYVVGVCVCICCLPKTNCGRFDQESV